MPYMSVHIDLDDLDTEDLIEELKLRGLQVIDKEDSGAFSESKKDKIYDLYRVYVNDDNFEKHLKKFFEEVLDIVVV